MLGGRQSFIPRLIRSSQAKEIGNNQYRRALIPRRSASDEYEEEYKSKVELSFFVLMLGGRLLSKAINFEQGLFSARHTKRLVQDGVIPVHRPIPSYNIAEMGRKAIRYNMKALASDAYTDYFPSDKSLVVCMIDGLALEERVGVNESIMPPCFTGLCRHCVDPTFVNYDSAVE